MSKEPEKLICDWCKNVVDKDNLRCEVKVINKNDKDNNKTLDCCSRCFKRVSPGDSGGRGRLTLGF